LQYGLRNKINKKSLLRHPLRVFVVGLLHIHTLHLTTFFNAKTLKKIKKR